MLPNRFNLRSKKITFTQKHAVATQEHIVHLLINELLLKKYLISIPVYNENDVLYNVAQKTIQYAANGSDVLFVDDGSTDGSQETLSILTKEHKFVKVIQKEKNFGYGSSLITSFDYAIEQHYDFVITMDCDSQHEPEDLHKFFGEDENIDILSGSRYLPNSQSSGIVPPQDRVEINKKITQKINRYYNYNLTDSFCGYKRIKLNSILDGNFSVLGYAFPLEFWAYSKFKNLKIKEVDVNKIYITDDRSFGVDLDYKRKRYKYYLQTWFKAHYKYFGKNLMKYKV